MLGVLGTSDDGTYVYYATKNTFYTSAGVFLWRSGTVTPVATTVATEQLPPDHRHRPRQRRRSSPALRVLRL